MDTVTRETPSTEMLASQIREEGWCLIEDVLPEDSIASIRDKLVTIGQGEPENKAN